MFARYPKFRPKINYINQELERRINDLVRIALFTEQKRIPLRRDEITKKVLAPYNRLFNRVFAEAQKRLKETFGLELVELPTRAGLEKDDGGGAAAEDDLAEARKATGMKKKMYVIHLQTRYLRANGGSAAASGSKSYILRSTLNSTLIDIAAQTDENILEEEAADLPSDDDSDMDSEDDDEERPPRSYGSIISWSHTEQVGSLGILYVILALILVHGRVLPESDLRSFLRQLHLPANGSPVHFTTSSTLRSLSVDNYLHLLWRQQYLERRVVGEANKPGGNKRMRATQAPRDDENSNQMYEWRWGPRAICEVGEQKIAEFVAEFMVDGGDADDEEDNNRANRNRRQAAKEEKVKKMVTGIEKAAGGRLSAIS
ncbi:hypothetical protein H1R20_g3905, partial [Candolleomyces eurysporus]